MALIFPLLFILTSIGLAWYLLSRDRGAKEPKGAIWGAVGLGVVAFAASVAIESTLLPQDLIHGKLGIVASFFGFMAVALIEEGTKFLPLSWVIYNKPHFNEHTDGIIYFALCGAAFGLIENLGYVGQMGGQVGIIRIVLMPFFHAATTAIIGFYLANAKLAGKPRSQVMVPFLGVMALHGLYDFGLGAGSILLTLISMAITAGLTIDLFRLYRHATILDEQLGLSAVGRNNFCRACGQPNPHHMLYCERCGKQT